MKSLTDEWGRLRTAKDLNEFAPPPSRQSVDDRLECLRVAADVAKMGLAHDVFATAERYYRFATGQPVEDEAAGLTFKQRLDALTREFLREEKSDQRKMLHELEEYVKSYELAFGDLDEKPASRVTDEMIAQAIMEHG